jgi:hypothetical protein
VVSPAGQARPRAWNPFRTQPDEGARFFSLHAPHALFN